ncbi:MAG: glycoside hydrolase family 57 protein [Vicinamibacterales bacterium]
MNIWHDTVDAPRTPRRVSPGQDVDVIVGTWPIGPGQSVWVTWQRVASSGDATQGNAVAEWQRNTDGNSYWMARLPPFGEGDRVSYTVEGSSPEGAVQTAPVSFRVRPALYVAWLWHQHQPLYRDPAAPDARGSYRYPWVRLHAIRDYYSMPALAAEHEVHVTFNLTPVLLRQIDDYVQNGATDSALDLTRCPAETLTRAQVEDLLSTFFDADWHNQVYVHPRYRELFEQRTASGRFSAQDLRDLQMWFNLAWFGHEFRIGDVRLITGDTVTVARFVRQQRWFSHDDVLAMVEEQYKILRAVVPIHRALQDSGRIEVSTTPGFHPILPLLIDTDSAYIDRPGTSHPTRYAYPEDAAAHVALACSDYLARFARRPAGMWPAEGAVSAEAVQMIGGQGVSWIATDAGVLARSGQWGYRASEPQVLCQPYRASDDAASIALYFRDTDLSDGIGFRYGQYVDADAAVLDFVHTIEHRYLDRLDDDEDRVLTVVLDGENAWGGYPDDGRPFLHALYSRLSSDSRLKTVTFSEYLLGSPTRGIEPHPVGQLTRVYNLASGSWIDEPGSSPGVDLGTWIGEPEENAAWNLLGLARTAVARTAADAPAVERAHQSLMAAEGSDWFWWFGSDQESRNDAVFDELFRAHLRGAYQALDLEAPKSLEDSIVAHPVVWTFTHSVPTVRRRDQVSIRTNCPGRLTYRIDDSLERVETLVAVGGVMAGARRFQVTLGPFPASAQRLAFRFYCEHPGCQHESPCCLSGAQAIALGARARAPRRTSAHGSNTQPRGSHANHQ